MPILVGFEKGTENRVEIPLHHTVISAITRAGKSETTYALIDRATETRFLIFDVKTPRDYEGVGVETPIFIEEKTDPLMIKRLLESQSHITLKFEFPELIKVCKKNDTYRKILDEINNALKTKIHPIKEDKLLVLQHLLTKLVRDLERTPIADRLELKGRINVMNLSDVSIELQQLALYSTFKHVLEKEENLVLIIDESHRFVPEPTKFRGSTACREMIVQTIKEGGAKGIWVWLIDQTITGVNKEALKQCWIWILGKQRELNEAKRTLDQIPFKIGLDYKDIMRLEVGHFIVCKEDGATLTYVQPSWLSEEKAIKVSMGEISVEDAYQYKLDVVTDKMWKEKCQLLEQKVESKDHTISDLRKELDLLQKRIDTLSVQPREGREESELEPMPFDESRIIALVDERVNQRILDFTDVHFVMVDVNERIKELVKEDFLASLISKMERLPDISKKGARYIFEKENVSVGDLYFFLYHKKGRPKGAFYNNVLKPLEEISLIQRDKYEISWTMDVQLLSRFKDFMDESDIKTMSEYLLSLII